MTGMPRRITPIQNLRQARGAAARDRNYDRRNLKIAIAAQFVIVAVLLLTFGDLRAAIQGLGAIDLGFMAIGSVPVILMNMRNEPATGLAAIRSTTSANVDEIALAMQNTFNCAPQQTEGDGVVLLACETSRSNLSYGEWIVLSLRTSENGVTSVEALSWNTSPTITLGINRRNLHRLATSLALKDVRELTHRGSGKVVARWIAAGILTGRPTPRPSWHSGLHAA